MSQKIRSLDELRSALSTIHNINAGGCGISALAMYLWLAKNLEKKTPKIYFCYKSYSQDTYINNDVALKNNDFGSLDVPNHVMLGNLFKKFDSDGVMSDFKETYKWHHKVDLNTLIQVINNQERWNPAFKRKESVPTIESWIEMKLPILEEQ